MNDINENAKVDWMNLVKKHKKKQKGLPSLSTLNTNAGNVEKNIELFNMMQPASSITVNASNGNVEAGGMGESLQLKENVVEKIILHYENLPIEVVTKRGNPGGYYDYGMGQWYPDDDEVETINVDWDYELDKNTVIEVLQDIPEVQLELDFDDSTSQEFDDKLLSNFEHLVEKYEELLKKQFYDDALEDAQQNFPYDREYTYYEESQQHTDSPKINEALDDVFDMSMRTLL